MTVSYFPPGIATGIEPGAYVTDGYNLFAILSVAEGGRHEPLVTYEDCRTLELLVCPIAELRRRHLDLVRPASPVAASPASPVH